MNFSGLVKWAEFKPLQPLEFLAVPPIEMDNSWGAIKQFNHD
jgi:hypothetical protein